MRPSSPGFIYQAKALQIREDSTASQCAKADSLENYDLGLHIFAVFLILLCGTLACAFPTIVKAFPQLAISKRALFICRHFGTGVLIAMAFAHLLPTAFENLWDDCLAYFWTEGYDAMPGFLAMISALSVALIEMGFTYHGFRHVCCPEPLGPRVEGLPFDRVECAPGCMSPAAVAQTAFQSEPRNSPVDVSQKRVQVAASEPTGASRAADNDSEQLTKELNSAQIEQRMILQVLLLEAGILFHSVFIGLSISLSTGTTFTALTIAIAFHQIFEGLALGARIAAIPSFKVSSYKPWLMASAYGFTCPLGQIIGLGVRTMYNPEGQTGLLVVGIANAISAGMIIYAGLVQLLGEELLSEKSYLRYTFRMRVEAVVSLILGALLMSMIAIWA